MGYESRYSRKDNWRTTFTEKANWANHMNIRILFKKIRQPLENITVTFKLPCIDIGWRNQKAVKSIDNDDWEICSGGKIPQNASNEF